MDSITSGKQRQKVRAETWVKITINPEEIALTPSDVLAKVTKKNNDLSTTVEGKSYKKKSYKSYNDKEWMLLQQCI